MNDPIVSRTFSITAESVPAARISPDPDIAYEMGGMTADQRFGDMLDGVNRALRRDIERMERERGDCGG